MKFKLLLAFPLFAILNSCSLSDQERNERVIIGNEYSGIKSSEAKSLAKLADSTAKNHDYHKAHDYYVKANSVEPDNPNILNSLANIESLLGKTEEAITHFKQVINIDSNYLQAYASYGTALGEAKRYSEAIPILKMGFQRSKPTQFDHYVLSFNLAIYNYKAGNCKEASQYIGIAGSSQFHNENFNSVTRKTAEIIKRDCSQKM